MAEPAFDLEIDRSCKPFYRQILQRMQALIVDGHLPAGFRLPNQRSLARRLNVNVATVNRAYREAARRRLVISSPRRGTHVAPQAGFLVGWNGLQGERADLIDMENNASPIDMPMQAMSAVFAEISAQEDLRHIYGYSSIYGREEHRRAIAGWLLRHGICAEAGNLVLTCGANHGIYLVLAVLSRPGDTLVADELAYPFINELSRLNGLKVQSLRRIGGRLDLEHAAALFAECRPRFLFVTPDFSSPTTEHLDDEERQELARLCRKANCAILEDSVHLGLVEPRGRPMQSYLPESTFFVTSFSKTLAPGLCFGAVLCPDREFTETVGRRLGIVNRMASPIMAEIVCRLIGSNEMARVMGFVRSEYRTRNRIAAQILAGFDLRADPYGTHFWIELPEGANASQLCQLMRRNGVSVLPDRVFAATGRSSRAGFRATLGALPRRHQVIMGCRAIAMALKGEAG
ncbi:MAG: PLP-dependent aminotransferase family protein [Sneathiellaceae bacterium]